MIKELIDEIKMLSAVQKEYYGNSDQVALVLDKAADMIQSLSEKLNSSQMKRSSDDWIPCEDHVPVNDEFVLAWNENPIVAYYDGVWYSNDGNFDEGISPITYWMPLPEEPKELSK